MFSSNFLSTQPAPMLGNTDLRYHISRLYKHPQHITCRVLKVNPNEMTGFQYNYT